MSQMNINNIETGSKPITTHFKKFTSLCSMNGAGMLTHEWQRWAGPDTGKTSVTRKNGWRNTIHITAYIRAAQRATTSTTTSVRNCKYTWKFGENAK